MSTASGQNRGVWAPLFARLFAGAVALLGLAGIGFAASRSPELLLPGSAPHDSQLASALSAPLGPTPSGVVATPASADAGSVAPSPGGAVESTPGARCPCPCPSSTAGATPAPSTENTLVLSSSAALTPDGRVILNRAGAAELTQLPGVGARRAASILELRARLGRFRRADELLRIKGIGPRMLERLLPRLVVDAPPEPVRAQ